MATSWLSPGLRALFAALALGLAAIFSADDAGAHAKVAASTPADQSTVAAGLDTIALTFSTDIRMTKVTLTRTDDGSEVAITSDLPGTFVKEVNLTVDPLVPGSYDATWIAVSKDGHVMQGTFSFTVTA